MITTVGLVPRKPKPLTDSISAERLDEKIHKEVGYDKQTFKCPLFQVTW